MKNSSLRTVGAVLAIGLAAAACNRQEPANPPKSMASSQGTTAPDTGSTAGAPGSTTIVAGPGSTVTTPGATVTTPGGGTPGATSPGAQEPPPGAVAMAPPPAGSPAPGAAPGDTAPPGAAGSAAPAPSGERGMGGVAGASAGPVAGTDRAFVSEAANAGLAEIEAARLISARTDNDQVKNLAEHMERAHASANEELKRIASEKGIELPTTIGGEPRGQLSRLTTLSKPEVDQAFVRDFGIDAHQKAISLFERQAREGQDPDLKAYAERTLPRLREHLSMAQEALAARSGQAGPAADAPR